MKCSFSGRLCLFREAFFLLLLLGLLLRPQILLALHDPGVELDPRDLHVGWIGHSVLVAAGIDREEFLDLRVEVRAGALGETWVSEAIHIPS